eukprot:5103495-Pyramimonas_sp.AAC.1
MGPRAAPLPRGRAAAPAVPACGSAGSTLTSGPRYGSTLVSGTASRHTPRRHQQSVLLDYNMQVLQGAQ